jgi:HlyD family secretion protein
VKGEQGTVFVVQAGVAHRRAIRIGSDNGLRMEILEGLSPDDEVVQRPSGALTDGAAVEVISRSASAEKQ